MRKSIYNVSIIIFQQKILVIYCYTINIETMHDAAHEPEVRF